MADDAKPAETATAANAATKTADGKPAEATNTDGVAADVKVTDWEAEATKWKALSRQNENRAKENATKAKEFDTLTEAQKSEQERLNDRVTVAEAKAAAAEAKALKADVSVAKGVPASLLSGSTLEELEASADELLKFRGEQKPAPVDFGGGAKGGDVKAANTEQLTREQLKGMKPEEIMKARADGRLDKLLNPKK
ncbi:MAG TPA: hypothetical protein VGP24_06895 [Glaciihabitans sp.]|jgi:hypothetical protein|nr:hypothetical protein [Glaciihabitans sp.]